MRLQSKCCCRLHCWLLSGPRTQRMSLTRRCSGASRKCRLIWTVTRLFDSLFDPAVETTESIVAACCHNRAEIKADVDAQVLSHAERGNRCLGIASSNEDGKWVFRGKVTFSDPPRPDTADVIFGAGELGIQVRHSTPYPPQHSQHAFVTSVCTCTQPECLSASSMHLCTLADVVMLALAQGHER